MERLTLIDSGTGPFVHTRFSRWSSSGVWEGLFPALAEDSDNEYAMSDATIVRAHQHSAGAAVVHNRKI